MKEKILEAFDYLGFKMDHMEGLGYGFEYEGSNYFYMPMDNDEDYVSICVPGIYEIEEGEDLFYYKLMDKVNSSMKYVKCYKYGDRVWLFYERELLGGEDLLLLLSHMILSLEASYIFARKTMAALKAEEEAGNGDSTELANGEDCEEADDGSDHSSDLETFIDTVSQSSTQCDSDDEDNDTCMSNNKKDTDDINDNN